MKASDNLTEWMKIGHLDKLSFIVNDVICYAAGCFINFININTGEELKHIASAQSVNGDGVSVIRGHRGVYTFAYAENAHNAELYVKNYPSFDTVVKFKDGPPEGYSNMAFSETSLLVTVGRLPNYTIMVWNWRKREKIGEFKNKLSMENQILRCSWGKPIYMTQMVRNTNHIYLWDVFICCRRAIIAKHQITLPDENNIQPFSDMLWTTEGGMFIVDIKGCVYSLNEEMVLFLIIEVDLNGEVRPSICWYKGGLAVAGPNKEIRHYKKSGEWVCDWTIELDVIIRNMYCNKADYLIGVTNHEEIVKISNVEEMTYLKHHDTNFNDFCLIYPTGEHIVALRVHKFLAVYEVATGKVVNTMNLKSKALTIAENPEFPYIVVGYENGTLELISVYKPEKLTVMASFSLTSNPISTVQFFEHGRVIVTGFLDIGEFFLIEGLPGTQMKVITNINVNRQIVDYMLVASKHCYRLFLIPVTSKHLAGNKIIRYCIITKDNINVKEYEMEDSQALYYRILPTTDSNRDRLFYLLPFKCRNIHLLETKRGDPLAKVVAQIRSGHQMRHFNLRITKLHAVSWGYDGFVICRDNKFEKNVGMSLAHHRYFGGVKKAYIDPLGKYIISLGRENVLACTNVVATKIDEDLKANLHELKTSTKYALMFKRPTIGFKPEERFHGKTWLEVQKILETEKEEEICRDEKQAIMKEFLEIQSILTGLVTKNQEAPENEKLDTLEFYLDTALYNKKKEKNKEDCKHVENYLKALIVAQDEVTDHLIKEYWDTMTVKGANVRGIFFNTTTKNYVLLPVSAETIKRNTWIAEQRKVEQYLSRDSFEPWLMVTEEQLLEQFKESRKLETEDYGNLAGKQGLIASESLADLSVATQIALDGTITRLFIERNLYHYKQNQIVSFYQGDVEQTASEDDAMKLKLYFNVLFNDLQNQKRKEMTTIKVKNARLRTIISEINYFSEKKIFLPIIDPEWEQSEEPELITKVFENELSITPYISPSEQAILDAKAAEEERIRLALLADDFRERALMAMMNGVLEVKWEDELKKDVPMPKCMLEKEPEKFNEEDLRSIRDYEEKVAFLNSERERYKNLLDVEFTKLSTSVRDSIRKFNQKLKNNIEHKMQIDSALNQDNLKINRIRLHQFQRIVMVQKHDEILRQLEENENLTQKLHKTVVSLVEELSHCHENREVLEAKEKLLEKAFKKEFHNASPIVQEQAAKVYKKRPKTAWRQIQTYSGLLELARCAAGTSQEPALILTNENREFLRILEQMDQLVNMPPFIDEPTFNLICKHRRLKIEAEIKMRACMFQITDGESTIATFQKRIVKNKEKRLKLVAERDQAQADYVYLIHNIQTQMVLRRGLVEIPLFGHITDFDDAIIVPKEEVVEINKKIIEAGAKKIDVIMKNMAFRRKIMAVEWEHKKLRLIINDLIEQFRDVENVQLTKEMQQYLKCKRQGHKIETMSFEMEVEIIAMSFENRIKDMKEKHTNIKKQISTYKAHNISLDQAISNVNIDVCYLNLQKDKDLEEHHAKSLQSRMDALLRRNCLLQQIQKNHNEILMLQTELELLRLKTYPTFKYKLLCN